VKELTNSDICGRVVMKKKITGSIMQNKKNYTGSSTALSV
jgi:hypothetical protein